MENENKVIQELPSDDDKTKRFSKRITLEHWQSMRTNPESDDLAKLIVELSKEYLDDYVSSNDTFVLMTVLTSSGNPDGLGDLEEDNEVLVLIDLIDTAAEHATVQ